MHLLKIILGVICGFNLLMFLSTIISKLKRKSDSSYGAVFLASACFLFSFIVFSMVYTYTKMHQ